MLTEGQAFEIVQSSIGEIAGRAPLVGDTLQAAGITAQNLPALATAISADPQMGVPRFQHFLDPNVIFGLDLGITIKDFADLIIKLSVGKLCSNPYNPHPQICCPYPTICPQCKYPVR